MTPSAEGRWFRYSLWTLSVVVASVVAFSAFYLYYSVNSTIRNAYAVSWVADMVVEHMKTHDGAWPKGWDDLVEPYETCVKRSGHPWTLEELRGRVDVDWSAEPKTLADANTVDEGPPFRVIWLRDGSVTHLTGAEPNQIVLEYLQERKAETTPP